MRTARADNSVFHSEPDTILRAGDRASFDGILINNNHYRSFTLDHRISEDFQTNMDKYVKCNPPPLIQTTRTNYFFTGFLLGVVTCIVLCH